VVGGQPVTFGQLGIAKRTEFARATLKGSANAFGVAFGIHGQLTPNWQMGARFLSQLSFKLRRRRRDVRAVPTGLILAAGNPSFRRRVAPVDAVVAPVSPRARSSRRRWQTQIRHPAADPGRLGYTGIEHHHDHRRVLVRRLQVVQPAPSELPRDVPRNDGPSRVLQEDLQQHSGIRLGAEYRLLNGTRCAPAGLQRPPRRR